MAKTKNYEELEITDDFMFGKVMEDKELCRETLECLLGHEIGELMGKGYNYRELPESNVIFICTFDPFGKGHPKYTFEYRCNENPGMTLNDQTYKWFYNCMCDISKVPKELKSLYRYIQSGQADSGLTERLHTAVVRARKNEIWRSEYMKELLIYQDMKDEGREEGREEGRVEGQNELMLKMICRKYAKEKTIEQMAEEMEVNIENIKPLYEMVSNFVAENKISELDGDTIYEGMIERK